MQTSVNDSAISKRDAHVRRLLMEARKRVRPVTYIRQAQHRALWDPICLSPSITKIQIENYGNSYHLEPIEDLELGNMMILIIPNMAWKF